MRSFGNFCVASVLGSSSTTCTLRSCAPYAPINSSKYLCLERSLREFSRSMEFSRSADPLFLAYFVRRFSAIRRIILHRFSIFGWNAEALRINDIAPGG
ncbi:MAG: hypothetical protein LBJ16_04350 [Holosporaceae bacterium]|nr:hypothetical protein [Holosporaceae bacterium]